MSNDSIIVTNELKENYSILPNAVVNSGLSNGACRLYWLLAIKPDGYVYYQKPLMKTMQISEKTFRKYRDELVKAGWLINQGQQNNADGTFSAVSYRLKVIPEVQKLSSEVQKLSGGKKHSPVKNGALNNKGLNKVNTDLNNINNTHTHTSSVAEEKKDEAKEKWFEWFRQEWNTQKKEMRSSTALFSELTNERRELISEIFKHYKNGTGLNCNAISKGINRAMVSSVAQGTAKSSRSPADIEYLLKLTNFIRLVEGSL